MAYLYKCTAKHNACCGKIPKGTTVQVVMQTDTMPRVNDIREALKRQVGIDAKYSFSQSDFIIEKMK